MRVLTFADGFESASAPTQGSIQQNSLATYATDADYVTGKGSAAAEGDVYYNTTYDAPRAYQNSAWHFLRSGVLLQLANDAAFVTAKGAAAASGDIYLNTTDGCIHWYGDGAWRTGVSLNQTQTMSGKTLSDALTQAQISTPSSPSSGYNKIYPKSGNLYAYLDSDGTEHTLVETVDSGKNWILNGGFDFWQRGTSFAAASHAAYSADRFKYEKVTTGAAHTLSRSTDVPTYAESGYNSTYSLKVDCTTADAAAAAADLVAISHTIEGYDWAELKGKKVTLSFWVKTTKTGTYCVAFRNNGADRAYVSEYTVSVTDTWEKKTVTLTLNPSGGTDDFTTGAGLRINWVLFAGTNYHTTSGSWVSNSRQATSNQVNACDDTANNFFLAQVKLNLGQTATTFNRRGGDLGQEELMCERFYQKSYARGVDPAAVSSLGVFIGTRGDGASCSAPLRPRMRITPTTVTLYSPTSGTSANVRNYRSAADIAATADQLSDSGYTLNISGSSSVDDSIGWHHTAECEL